MKNTFRELWSEINRDLGRTARRLFPERLPGYRGATLDLASLAINRSAYELCKARGDVTGAQVYLNTIGVIAENLPAYVSQEMKDAYGALHITWRLVDGEKPIGEPWYATQEQANEAACVLEPRRRSTGLDFAHYWLGSTLKILAQVK